SIPIITTIVVLSVGAGLLVASIASVLFGLLVLYGFITGLINSGTVFLIIEKIAYFFIIAFLSGYLAYIAKKKTKELEASRQSLELKNKKLIKTQEQLIQSEKLASITQITVSLNHEINNPLTSVLADIQFTLQKMKHYNNDPKELERIVLCLQTAEQEALRIKSIMEDLRRLTRPVVEDYIPGIKMINIKKSVEESAKNTTILATPVPDQQPATEEEEGELIDLPITPPKRTRKKKTIEPADSPKA
ncbi:MAG: hypothetical protein WC838_04945, partial [Candidatus Margulisiibacteriota bacterium]